MVREIEVLKKLSKKKSNVFTTKLIDVIFPDEKEYGSGHLFIVMEFVDNDLKKMFQDC